MLRAIMCVALLVALAILQLPVSAQASQIRYGETVTGEIEPGGEQYWLFEGSAGDNVNIQVTSEDFEPFVLFGPMSDTLITNAVEPDGVEINEMLSSTDYYMITIESFDRSEGGSYTLTLLSDNALPSPTPPPILDPDQSTPVGGEAIMEQLDTKPLEFDTLTSADYTLATTGTYWTFEAQVGDEVTITVSSDDFDPVITLGYYGDLIDMQQTPDGGRATNTLVLSVTKAGTWMIGVGDSAWDDVGAYTIVIQRESNPVEVVVAPTATPFTIAGNIDSEDQRMIMLYNADPLEIGTAAVGAVISPKIDYWHIVGQAGDEITITVETENFDPYVVLGYDENSLFDSSGGEGNRSKVTIPYTLEEDGVYLIAIYDYGGKDSGEYSIIVESGLNAEPDPIDLRNPPGVFNMPLLDEPTFQIYTDPLSAQGGSSTEPIGGWPDEIYTWRDITFEYQRDWLITEAADSLVISPPDSEGSLPRLHIYPPEQIAAFFGEPITDIGRLAELTFNQFVAEIEPEEIINYLPYMTYMNGRYAIIFSYRTEGAAGVQVTVELNGEIYWIVTRQRLENDEGFAYNADEIIRSISTASLPSEPVSYTMCATADGVRFTRGDGFHFQPEVNYNGACEDSAAPEATAPTPVPDVPTPVTSENNQTVESTCFASAARTINMRTGPGIDFDVAGQMTADELIIGQQAGQSGTVWYQLTNGFWVREDVIELRGDCANIPAFSAETPADAETSFVAASVTINRPGSYDAARDVASIWTLNEFRDMTSPGVQTYEVFVLPGSSYRLSFTWCADTATRLREILGPLSVRFYVSGVELVASQILQTDRTNCRIWDTILSGWRSGETVFVDLQYSLAGGIFDGTLNYAPGSYRHEITITVG